MYSYYVQLILELLKTDRKKLDETLKSTGNNEQDMDVEKHFDVLESRMTGVLKAMAIPTEESEVMKTENDQSFLNDTNLEERVEALEFQMTNVHEDIDTINTELTDLDEDTEAQITIVEGQITVLLEGQVNQDERLLN